MTRAADGLGVAGSRGVNRIPPGCWYELIDAALKPDAVEVTADDGDGSVWRWRKSAGEEIATGAVATAPAGVQHVLPDWLKRHAPPAPATPRAASPSAALCSSGAP